MRITVDTKSDSLDDIKRVISLLQAVTGGQQSYTNYSQSSSAPSYSPMSIFSDDTPSMNAGSSPAPASQPSSSSSAGASADLFTMFSGSSASTSSPSSTAGAPTTQPYHNSDDILREVSNREGKPHGNGGDDDDNDGPLGDYEIIPYD